MNPRNIIGIETHWGFRSFELHEGDLTNPEFAADLLVISSFSDDYTPIPNTLIGALQIECRLEISALAADSEFDLRDTFGLWISRELHGCHFERLMCLELRGGQ